MGNKNLFEFTDKVYENWNPNCGIEGAAMMPLFGSSTKTVSNFDTVVGETIVDLWFYEKYKGVILYKNPTNYVLFSTDRRNIERFFGVRPSKRWSKPLMLPHFIRGHINFKNHVVDHINNDNLDNRFCNLRTATHQQNGFNQSKSTSKNKNTYSKYKGVFYDKHKDGLTKRGERKKCWRSVIMFNNKHYYSYHQTEIEAAIAYNDKALKYFGEFANLNVIED